MGNVNLGSSWAACHGGMLGLRYFVTLRLELVVNNTELFTQLINCVFKGLTGSDDEVHTISAAVLLPFADQFVSKRPKKEIAKLLNIMWEYISDLKHELNTSVGNVMDLLGTLCTFSKVLDVVLSDSGASLEELVPKLYQFLRHSIIDVRKAVLRSLKTFLTLEHDSKAWVSVVTLRLLYQNILLEQNDAVLELSVNLWTHMMDFYTTKDPAIVLQLFEELWPVAFPLLLTPIGTARRFCRRDDRLLIRPLGKSYAESMPASTSADSKLDVNIDGPIISGDTLIVQLPIFICAKVNSAQALGHAAAIASIKGNNVPQYVQQDIMAVFNSPMSSQRLVLGMFLEEFGKNIPTDFTPLTEFSTALEPLLMDGYEGAGDALA